MPTYQYACTECGHRFEQVQSFSDDALTECPQCQGRLRKLFNAVGVVFKGSGFYRNDSREAAGKNGSSTSAGATGEKSGEKSGAASGDKGAGTSSDKPAEKASEKKPAAGGGDKPSSPASTGGSAKTG
ncbi:FmdB family zinc ribbon protein [Nocardioides sp. AX2bis]|uniref:FmdB family zinc ribbon protein n=1 Tax=Nocardioides sp. AX2bis TaxID=2653157 RepID=UPI0012F40B50|nr:FmdB family zinc ribbon protein [Nocardioides sp. AX2bis]VXC16271.1 FmdB family transcriptional regulator [Nocardioides sp. AX2bis]